MRKFRPGVGRGRDFMVGHDDVRLDCDSPLDFAGEPELLEAFSDYFGYGRWIISVGPAKDDLLFCAHWLCLIP